MSDAVLEIVEFRASGEAGALFEAAKAMETWLKAQPGFRWRRLSQLDGDVFVDTIEWADMASDAAAAAQIMSAEPVAGFMALIEPTSVVMRHAHIALAQ